MKMIFLATVFTLGFGGFIQAEVAAPETLVVRVGQQKTAARGKITVKVAALAEDSRCPVGVNCVWAGNAKIRIALAKGKKAAKSFELNSTLQPQSIIFEGYEFRLVDLTPRPGETAKMAALHQTAIISVTKH